ncbi:hypothetical protein GYMLUDRAFT_172628 [Collybiopsis luxurians FD-317 M1]|uniref:Uncharacterized protein n=1 Tax=Collybiopsis luxurians FD-317 M1 TaxID=944289 RepID=A0A0D0CH82_9AGAR|nr:hypothetical protein GYMLUDRAFT_172628 [Collybiopsis luxurians FD-317 M1]
MSSLEVIQALGPGNQVSNLNKFAASYKVANSNFADLLTYPFLQSIVSGERGNQDLRTMVVDGSARFGHLCTTDISIARQVISYAKTVPVLLPNLTIGGYATTYKPLVAKYVAQALASANGNEQFFESFQTYLILLDKHIAPMTGKITDLTTQIDRANEELAQTNVGRVIGDIIKALVKLSDSSEDRDIQIAALLDVSLETLKSSFSQLWSNQQHLKELIQGLTILKDNLSAIQNLFTALSNSLAGIISDTKSLLYLWSDVQAHLGTVETVDRNFTAQEIQRIADQWAKAEQAAAEYIKAVTSSGATRAPSLQSLSKTTAARSSTIVPRIPRTKAELRIAELIASLGPEARAAARARRPPKDTQAVLDEMALQTSGVMKQFNASGSTSSCCPLLILFYMPGHAPAPMMVLNYQQLYYQLQQATVPVARDLQSYSEVVLFLLPFLVASNSAAPPEIGLDTYLAAHVGLAIDFKKQADKLYEESLEYQNRWNKAINAVIQAVDDCKKNIEDWEQEIDDLSEQVKQLTLQAVLLSIGAIVIFAASALLPGGSQYPFAYYLNAAIRELKSRVDLAKDTVRKLETLLPLMERVAQSLTSITNIWRDISENLDDVTSWNVLLAANGTAILDAARPILINAWANIRGATQRYIDIITGQARSPAVYK